MSGKMVDRKKPASLQLDGRASQGEELSPAQQELLRDMRASLKQMKRGELLPARETLREMDLDLELKDNASTTDTQVQITTEEAAEVLP